MKRMQLYNLFILLPILVTLSGCGSMTRGAVEALMNSRNKDNVDNRKCYVRGRPFDGIAPLLDDRGKTEKPPILKILMVHGIGSHKPGYATQLAENLAKALHLPKVQEQFKEIQLASPKFPNNNLGILRVSRFLSEDNRREMQFFELTWDFVIEKEKSTIDFDNSEAYSFRRASINKKLKFFVNDTVPDVLMYYGRFREPILVSVGQSICWMMSEKWDNLPDEKKAYCDAYGPKFLDEINDNFVFITHSLGSRITSDALQRVAALVRSDKRLDKKSDFFEKKEISIFMLSNQLPLLQLGREEPEVTGQIDEICADNAPRSSERLFKQTKIIAFSDPNDLFSYTIPPKFLRDHIDSRLCPTLTNVSLNISPVVDIFGLGELANPLKAHVGYDNDERVIDLIVHGIGNENTSAMIKDRCEWTEAVPANF